MTEQEIEAVASRVIEKMMERAGELATAIMNAQIPVAYHGPRIKQDEPQPTED